MNVVNRGIISIKRNIWKNMLFFLLVLIVGIASITIMTTISSINNIEQSLLARVPTITILEHDYNSSEISQSPSMDTLSEIASSPYVRTYNISMHIEAFSTNDLWAPGFDIAYDRLPRELRNSDFSTPGIWRSIPDVYVEPFFLWGVQNRIIDFDTGQIELISGRTFSQTELDEGHLVAVVSNQFALTNSLSIGSKFTLENIIWDVDEIINTHGHGLSMLYFHYNHFRITEEFLEFEIIGIFDVNHEFVYARFAVADNELLSALGRISMLHGRIYTPLPVVSEMRSFRYDNQVDAQFSPPQLVRERDLEAQFLLYSSHDLESFVTSSNEMLPHGWQISDFRSVDNHTLLALNDASDTMAFFLLTAILAGFVILVLIVFLLLKERRQEIGIYLALGSKKSEIAKQILFEKIVITIVALCFSLVVGYGVSEQVSISMMRQNLAELQQDSVAERWANLPNEFLLLDPGRMTVDEIVYLSDTVFDLNFVTFFALMGTSIVLVSTIIPLVYIVKLEPKKMLL